MERASFVSRARNILRFRAFASFSSSSFFFVTLYASCPLRSTPAESPLLFLTNLHILPLACRRAHLSPPSVFFVVSFASLSPFCRRVDSLNSVIHLLFRWRARVFSRFFQFYYSPVVLPLIRVLSSSFFLSLLSLSFSLSSLSLRLLAVKSET